MAKNYIFQCSMSKLHFQIVVLLCKISCSEMSFLVKYRILLICFYVKYRVLRFFFVFLHPKTCKYHRYG